MFTPEDEKNIAQRVAFFEFIKNIPYQIGLSENDTSNYNCVTKSEMLGTMLAGIGLKSRPIICTFDWNETPFPAEILAMPRDPGETHQFLEVFIPETNDWVRCDPTWDTKLKEAGFEITTWDGQNHTELAVKPHIIYSPSESLHIMDAENDPAAYSKHMDKHRPFYEAINIWLQEERSVAQNQLSL